jgi:hypothetical protein
MERILSVLCFFKVNVLEYVDKWAMYILMSQEEGRMANHQPLRGQGEHSHLRHSSQVQMNELAPNIRNVGCLEKGECIPARIMGINKVVR